MSQPITPIVRFVVGNSLLHKTPLTRGIRAILQNPPRTFFPFTWFACFSSAAIFLRAAADIGLRTLGARERLAFPSSPPETSHGR